MFKPNVKKQVEIKFNSLFGKEKKPIVNGHRMDPKDAKNRNWPGDTYYVELAVDDTVLCTARSRDWRKAYKILSLEVEKMYVEGRSLPDCNDV